MTSFIVSSNIKKWRQKIMIPLPVNAGFKSSCELNHWEYTSILQCKEDLRINKIIKEETKELYLSIDIAEKLLNFELISSNDLQAYYIATDSDKIVVLDEKDINLLEKSLELQLVSTKNSFKTEFILRFLSQLWKKSIYKKIEIDIDADIIHLLLNFIKLPLEKYPSLILAVCESISFLIQLQNINFEEPDSNLVIEKITLLIYKEIWNQELDLSKAFKVIYQFLVISFNDYHLQNFIDIINFSALIIGMDEKINNPAFVTLFKFAKKIMMADSSIAHCILQELPIDYSFTDINPSLINLFSQLILVLFQQNFIQPGDDELFKIVFVAFLELQSLYLDFYSESNKIFLKLVIRIFEKCPWVTDYIKEIEFYNLNDVEENYSEKLIKINLYCTFVQSCNQLQISNFFNEKNIQVIFEMIEAEERYITIYLETLKIFYEIGLITALDLVDNLNPEAVDEKAYFEKQSFMNFVIEKENLRLTEES